MTTVSLGGEESNYSTIWPILTVTWAGIYTCADLEIKPNCINSL